ncbi:membrane fusion protein (multidrug efflux system) [Pseudomonas duriflava]|uniref:Membrane fusion protein (Multidrug efflux system) n=1 Tax=Pseudomonas duriflava TaxID=459528 RepID=A0A562Q6W3_9PSED|nr:HlyD family secretion protein [Pseudomonas duriflava]TWI52477.1 membrane fusion protein (multidrug efflux system) [Pseudomonas duriflava]
MSHKTAFSLVGAAVVLGALYACVHVVQNDATQTTDDAYITADSVLVAPKVAGIVAEVLVEDNQPVKAGQLLARIDDRDFVAAQASASAAVKAARAEVANLNAEIDRQAAIIAQASATMRATAASLAFAQANATRYRNLSKAGAGTVEERQKAEAELLQWQAATDRDAAARMAAEKHLAVLKAQRDVAAASVAKAEAALAQADLNQSYTQIVAPRDGVIAQRSVRLGAYVAQGKPLLAIVPVHEAYVVANFRETQLARMAANQSVEVRVDTFPDHVLHGRIDSLAPATGLAFSPIAPDNATGNFTKVAQRVPVKIVFEPGQPAMDSLRVGLSVVASVDTQEEKR